MNYANGQAMTPIETLRERLAAIRQAEAAAWAEGRNKRAMHLNAFASGYRTAIAEQETYLATRTGDRPADMREAA